MKKMTFVLLISLMSLSLAAKEYSYWNWTCLSTKIDRVKVKLLLDNRFRDGSEDHHFTFGTLNLSTAINDYWNAGVSYSIYKSEGKDKKWRNGRRLEFELNPHYKLDSGVKLSMRNRIEFRDLEGKGSANTRSRHRVGFFVPIKTEFKSFKGLFAANEFFINYDNSLNRWNENRLQPLGLSFQINKQTKLSVFSMIQQKRKRFSNDWTSYPGFGTSLSFKF